MKALVVAGVASGVGKTTVATGLMGALVARGLRVQGFKVGPDYIDPRLRLIGVILNRVASSSHRATVTEAIESRTGLPVLGAIGRDAGLTVPERYLGLVPPFERPPGDDYFSSSASAIARDVDLARLFQLAEVP